MGFKQKTSVARKRGHGLSTLSWPNLSTEVQPSTSGASRMTRWKWRWFHWHIYFCYTIYQLYDIPYHDHICMITCVYLYIYQLHHVRYNIYIYIYYITIKRNTSLFFSFFQTNVSTTFVSHLIKNGRFPHRFGEGHGVEAAHLILSLSLGLRTLWASKSMDGFNKCW